MKENNSWKKKEAFLDSNRMLLDDTLHEIRKINNQIKVNIHDLSKALDKHYIEDDGLDRYIHNTLKTIEGNSTLLSKRMDAYDILFNPASAGEELDTMLGVYGKVEKVYKCLYPSKKEKSLDVEFSNWAICPQNDELPHLTERGYRSKAISNKKNYQGSGLGLYLLKQICQTNNVGYQFDVTNETKLISGTMYNPFIVTLSFYD